MDGVRKSSDVYHRYHVKKGIFLASLLAVYVVVCPQLLGMWN